METVSVLGMDESYRCTNCGGFWLQNWVVNGVSDGKALEVQPIEEKKVKNGTNSCPTDGWILSAPPREVVPEGFVAGVCNACRNWWMPANTLFSYAEAMKAKHSYDKTWHTDSWKKMALPALGVVLAIGVIGGSVVLVQQQQRVSINASEVVYDLYVVYVGNGDVDIRFGSKTPLAAIQFRSLNELEYKTAQVSFEDNMYVVSLRGLEPGTYEYVILGRVYQFVVAIY